jgi:lipoic acid synthetase
MTDPAVIARPSSGSKPPWLKVRAPGGARYTEIKERLRRLELHTVCEEAQCPNIGECWGGGTATLMLLGDICTRGCRFCAVTTGKPRGVDTAEPEKVAATVSEMGLDYVVLTSVNRDDLPDGGADHFARTVENIKRLDARILVETLVPDFRGNLDSVARLVQGHPDVFAHNLETVRRLQRVVRDVRATYAQSLGVLRAAKSMAQAAGHRMLTKTSIMLGCGETDAEVLEAMHDLRDNEVDVVTFGQYLRPSAKHLAVERFVPPETFAMLEREARNLGFLYCASGPLVRSSYRAGEFYIRGVLEGARPKSQPVINSETSE